MDMNVGVLDHYNVSTRKLKETVQFYEDVLGFTNGPRPAFNFPGAMHIKFRKRRNKRDRQIIDAIKTEIFERIEEGAFSGTGKSCNDYKLAGISSAGRPRHGGPLTLSPGGGACWGCAGPRGISQRCAASPGCLRPGVSS